MHPRNRHQNRYNLEELAQSTPELLPFIAINKFQVESIDFANPDAVRALNKALLKHYYGVKEWDIPKNYLCPPIPGRADYIHFAADLLGKEGAAVRVLDIGVGANCVYPLIGQHEYKWNFVGTDIDDGALASAAKIIKANHLEKSIELRKQTSEAHVFKGIIDPKEKFDLTICNPPFHASQSEAMKGTNRKLKNLGLKTQQLNFGGQASELWCQGGESAFINKMIEESFEFKKQCTWFSTLISKEEHVPKVLHQLEKLKANIRKIEMSQGQKKSRIVAWSWSELPH